MQQDGEKLRKSHLTKLKGGTIFDNCWRCYCKICIKVLNLSRISPVSPHHNMVKTHNGDNCKHMLTLYLYYFQPCFAPFHFFTLWLQLGVRVLNILFHFESRAVKCTEDKKLAHQQEITKFWLLFIADKLSVIAKHIFPIFLEIDLLALLWGQAWEENLHGCLPIKETSSILNAERILT